MARFCGEHNSTPITDAAKRWKDSCLMTGQSLFSDKTIWNSENVDALDQYFANNLDEGEGNFLTKLETQLAPTAPEVKQLAAEMMWLMLLCPSNIGQDKKRESVIRIWSWSDEDLEATHDLMSDETLKGVGSAGPGYNNFRWLELVYFIQILKQLMRLSYNDRVNFLEDGWKLDEWLENIPDNSNRQLRHMLLFMLFPDIFERIFSNSQRSAIVSAFTNKTTISIKKLTPLEIDKQLENVRKEQEQDFGTEQLDFYVSPLSDLWQDKDRENWLFTWNPDKWTWDDLPNDIAATSEGRTVIQRWRCSNQNISAGDRAWLIRLGVEPKGIMATGNVISEPYLADHYEVKKAGNGEQSTVVDIEFTQIRDVFNDSFITLEDLSQIAIDKQQWTPQSSGIEIKKRSAGLLDRRWSQLSKSTKVSTAPERPKVIAEATNKIMYGPPGTGKTYKLDNLKSQYTIQRDAISREQWLSEELKSSRWFDVVLMSLYALGGTAKVADIEQHEFIRQKAKAIGRTRHIKQQIWATLQTHASEHSETVKYNKRHSPLIFDKNAKSEWFLVNAWQEDCEDLIQNAKRLIEGAPEQGTQHHYEFVTFHQAYSYEDFVEGIRPVQDEESGELIYKVVPGVFRQICQDAKNSPEARYAIFIDEINRGNIAKIFGELITLIEQDKRAVYDDAGELKNGMELTLPYSREKFGVPKNLDIYGTMNTADRSIALLDTALRRRFSFEEMEPNSKIIAGSKGDGYIEDGAGGLINLRALLDAMNQRIRLLLNRDLMLGHAYLYKVKDFNALKDVFLNQLIPLLQEYFYNDWHRIQLVFKDIGPANEKLEPQIIEHTEVNKADILGFDHDDFDDLVEYQIAPLSKITPEAIRKIYEYQE